jgi:hypothetical protein
VLNAVARTETPPPSKPTVYPLSREEERRLEAAFTYHPPKGDQPDRYHDVRQEALLLALAIARKTPPGRERERALETLELVVFLANAAIARGE